LVHLLVVHAYRCHIHLCITNWFRVKTWPTSLFSVPIKKATGFLVSVNSNFISLVCPRSVLIRSTAKVHLHYFVYECSVAAMPWPVAMATFLTTHSITLFIVSVPGSRGPTTHITLLKLTDCLPSQTPLIKSVCPYGEMVTLQCTLPLLRGVLKRIQLNFATGRVLKALSSVFGPEREEVQEDVENCIIKLLSASLISNTPADSQLKRTTSTIYCIYIYIYIYIYIFLTPDDGKLAGPKHVEV
jgi:hypothetical protein